MKIPVHLVVLMVIGGVSVATAFAIEFHSNGPDVFETSVFVKDGSIIVDRADGIASALRFQNDGSTSAIMFVDVDDGAEYWMRMSPDGTRFDFINVAANPDTFDIVIKTDTGNVGIGTNAPTERLDINGDLRVRGNIVSTGDICIGNCP